jgi:hypothetical protein
MGPTKRDPNPAKSGANLTPKVWISSQSLVGDRCFHYTVVVTMRRLVDYQIVDQYLLL